MAKQIWPDLALFEITQEDAVHAPSEQPGQAGLAHAERQLPHVLTIGHKDVEGVELDFLVVLKTMQSVEVGAAIDAQ